MLKGRVNVSACTRDAKQSDTLLNSDPRSFCDEDEVCKAMNDDRTLTLLNYTRKHGERGRKASITIREDVYVGAFHPIHVYRCMDSLLNICSVEVER